MLSDGSSRSGNVNFTGNGGVRFATGDLDFNGSLEAADWLEFIAFAESDMTGLSLAQTYQRGDLNGDGFNDVVDFGIFKDAFDAANGDGAFVDMLASIPEPTGWTLSLLGLLALLASSRRMHRIES